MKKINKKYFYLAGIISLFVFHLILYKIYMPRVNAFGCFDDCNNFLGGYFLLHGKRLFSEIFFNHNPLMAYVSFLVQFFSHPQNLYELILRHRQTLLIFGFIFNVVLLIRFGLPAFAFTIFYELTKFYLFGDRFLAEGFIIYPLIYLLGLGILKFSKKNLFLIDYIFAGVFAWFIIFMREPYVPATVVFYGFLLWSKKNIHKSLISLSIFLLLSLVTIFSHNVNEFFFNVVTANVGLAAAETTNAGLMFMRIFFYPVFILFGGEWGFFRYLLVAFDILFLISATILIVKKQWKLVLFAILFLGFLNLRFVEPGKAFYGAFHLLCWYGAFLFLSFYFVSKVIVYNKKILLFFFIAYGGILLFNIFSPLSFLYGKPDPQREFLINYGAPMQVGMVFNVLSKPSDTLFLDGFDDIIYWQAQRYSSYEYSWYTSLMPNFKKYTDERVSMFHKSPPDYYYGSCPQETNPDKLLPDFIKDSYVRLYTDKKPSCVWVKKSKVASITTEQWEKAQLYFYYLPKK